MSVLVAVGAGVAIGVALGLLGGGGSILAVPALVYLLGQDVNTAVPTSLLVVGIASLTGVVAHARDGDVRWRIAAGFALPGVVTSFGGAWVNSSLDQNVLLLVFAALMAVVAVHMLVNGDDDRGGERRFEGRARLLAAGAAGAAVGFLTGLLGVGGGFLIVPALILTLDLPMAVAVGTSLVVIVANSAAGFVANGAGTDLDWTVAGVFVAGGLAGAIPGSRMAARVDETRLRHSFAVFILVVALFVVVQVSVLGGTAT